MVYQRKYGVAATIDFDLFEVDGVDFRSDAAHASGDTKIMKDEGAEANTSNGFTDEGQGYSIVLTATEMQAARIVVYIVDQTATKVWLDRVLIIETYGHANAQHPFLLATSPGNTLDVAGTGEAGIDFDNAKGSHPTVPTVTTVTNDVGITQAGADKVWSSAARTLTSFGTLVADIWANGTRTLTGFGTLVSDIWNALTSGMTTAGSIGKKLSDWVLGADNKVEVSGDAHTSGQTVAGVTSDVGITQAGADKVWSSAARTLTSFGTLVSDIWSAGTRTLTSFGALVSDIWGDSISEPSAGAPPATPTRGVFQNWLWMHFRNKGTLNKTTGEAKIYNDAGSVIAKGTDSDDGTTFTKGEIGAP